MADEKRAVGPDADSTSSMVTGTKLTRGHSCVLCQTRKQRCDALKPCSNCVKAKVECVQPPPPAHPRRKRKSPEEDLLSRLKKCEDLLKKHGLEVQEDEEVVVLARDLPTEMDKIRKGEVSSGKLITESGRRRYIENNLWTELSEEVQSSTDRYDEGTSDDEGVWPEGAIINEASLLLDGLKINTLRSFHPEPMLMFRLWQTFIDNVNPLVKLIHNPTVQALVLESSGRLGDLSAPTEALLFSIYLSSISSLDDEECERMMGEPRALLWSRYMNATQQALLNAQVLKSNDLTVLQAFTIFLLSMRQHKEPEALWILTGTAVRLGQRIGLHRERANLALPAFEAEMRRRLWWQIITMDRITARLAGVMMGHDAFMVGDTKQPLNVNDNDLYPSMSEPPMEGTGITDMIFCSCRIEIGTFVKRWLGAPDLTSIQAKDRKFDDLLNHLKDKYLRYCDMSVPLHRLTAGMVHSAMSSLRFMAHHPRKYRDRGASLPQSEKDILFHLCLTILENDNIGHNQPSMKGYLWHMNVYFQLDALVYVLGELRTRTEGEEVDKAWRAIQEVFEFHRDLTNDTGNTLYFAIGTSAVKAWEMRAVVAAAKEKGNTILAVPEFIKLLKSQRGSGRSPSSASKLGSISTSSNYISGSTSTPNSQTGMGMSAQTSSSTPDLWQDLPPNPYAWPTPTPSQASIPQKASYEHTTGVGGSWLSSGTIDAFDIGPGSGGIGAAEFNAGGLGAGNFGTENTQQNPGSTNYIPLDVDVHDWEWQTLIGDFDIPAYTDTTIPVPGTGAPDGSANTYGDTGFSRTMT